MKQRLCRECNYRLSAADIRAGRTTCRCHDEPPRDSQVADRNAAGRPDLGATRRVDGSGEPC